MPDPTASLYLTTPVLDEADGFAPQLDAALAAADVACVLLRTRDGVDPEALRRLVRIVQGRGAAALVAEDPSRAIALDADGVHLEGNTALDDALRRLKPERIVGVGALALRDDAMEAGERTVDYLMFGELIDGAVPPFEERLDRVAWWAEIFQVPCVAWAYTMDEAQAFARAGAEFVALGDLVWGDPRGPAAAIDEVAARVRDGAAAFLAEQAERV